MRQQPQDGYLKIKNLHLRKLYKVKRRENIIFLRCWHIHKKNL